MVSEKIFLIQKHVLLVIKCWTQGCVTYQSIVYLSVKKIYIVDFPFHFYLGFYYVVGYPNSFCGMCNSELLIEIL